MLTKPALMHGAAQSPTRLIQAFPWKIREADLCGAGVLGWSFASDARAKS